MAERPAFIAEVGARCPLGLNALQTAMAARAGKLEIRESAMLDKNKRSVGLVRARFLPDELVGLERLVRLAAPALREAGARLAREVPLVLGIGEPERPDLDATLVEQLISRLAAASEVAIDMDRSQVVRAGNASLAFALEAGMRQLELGAPAVLVGCADSYVSPAAVAWLDAAHRLHAYGTEDGIVPSEGAAFLLLVSGDRVDRALYHAKLGPPPMLAAIKSVRTGSDESARDPDAPVTAEVITGLVQQALAASLAEPVWLVTDVDEFHRVREWSRVELRCHPVFEAVERTRLPDLFGDTGAATGALAAAFACRGWAAGALPRGMLLIALHADGPARGVVTVEEAR